jgi:hypothetical protein
MWASPGRSREQIVGLRDRIWRVHLDGVVGLVGCYYCMEQKCVSFRYCWISVMAITIT